MPPTRSATRRTTWVSRGGGTAVGVPSAPLDERERTREHGIAFGCAEMLCGAAAVVPWSALKFVRATCLPETSRRGRAFGVATLSACVRRSSWRSLRLRSRIRRRSRTRQLLQRSTLRDGRVGVGALRKTCAAAGGRDGQADGLAERGVRRGMLCLLVLRAASPRMVPPTRARGTCAHVGACCVTV